MTLMSFDSVVYSARRHPSPATKYIISHVRDLGARECIFYELIRTLSGLDSGFH